ncbi:MAG TPA: glucose 1-dehydrogenase [Chloroflexota bacterium]|nr:glucose 1-dehydrogenase [Chloroflexota bacterium]
MSVLTAFDLSGKVAVVTGGNMGLGEVFAGALAEVGARVVIAARHQNLNQSAAERITTAGGEAIGVPLDVTDPASVEAMIADVSARLGPIDILINNAGLCYHRPALAVPLAEFREVMEINLFGVWHCAQAVGRQMVERRSGVIVNIGSISGLIVNRPQMQPAYNASKAAVHQLTKSLAAEWAPFGVRVNAMAPGYFKTAMSPVDEPQFRRYWIEDAPMERYGLPEELGPTLIYLASDASRFMTGAVLVIDGGYTLW